MIAAATAADTADNATRRLIEMLNEVTLVSAKVVAVHRREAHDGLLAGERKASLEITNVYNGPAELKGKRFQAQNILQPGQVGSCDLNFGFLRTGEVGIWAVEYVDGEVRPLICAGAFDIYWPVIYRETSLYSKEDAEAVAKAIREVWLSADETKVKLVRANLYNTSPAVAACSVELLRYMQHPRHLDDFRQAAVAREVAARAKIAIDEVLTLADGTEWASSDQERLWWHVAHSKLNTRDANTAVRGIMRKYFANELPEDVIIKLVDTMISSEGYPVQAREEATRFLGRVFGDDDIKSAVFNVVINILDNNTHQEIRRTASAQLFRLTKPSQEQTAEIRKRLSIEHDPVVKAQLEGALDPNLKKRSLL